MPRNSTIAAGAAVFSIRAAADPSKTGAAYQQPTIEKLTTVINISFKSVTDEIFALTALHSRMLDPIGSPVTEILCRDQLPALRVMVKAAFSQIAGHLLPYIDRCDVDDEPSMALDFGSYASGLTAGSLMALRHYLEHLCALTVMATVCRPYAPTAADAWDRSLTSIFAAVSDLLTTPDSGGSPLSVRPTFY